MLLSLRVLCMRVLCMRVLCVRVLCVRVLCVRVLRLLPCLPWLLDSFASLLLCRQLPVSLRLLFSCVRFGRGFRLRVSSPARVACSAFVLVLVLVRRGGRYF